MKKNLSLVCLVSLILSCSTTPQQPETIVDKKKQAVEYSRIGNAYFNQGLYDRALEFFSLALAYNVSVDNERGIVTSYVSIGSVFMSQGNLAEAMKYFTLGYALAKKLQTPVLLAQTANKIGEVHLNTGNIMKSHEMFLEALQYENAGIPEEDLAILYHNIGSVLKRLGQPDQSLTYIEKAQKINLWIKRYGELATNYYMMASIYSEKGLYDKALEYAILALENDKKVENSLGIAKDFLALGIISSKQGNYGEAYAHFKKTYQIYKNLKLLYPTLLLDREFKMLLNYLITTGSELGKQDEIIIYKKELENIEKRLNP